MDVNLWIFNKAVFAAECHDAGWTTRLVVLYGIVNDAIDAACAAGAMRLFADRVRRRSTPFNELFFYSKTHLAINRMIQFGIKNSTM